MFCVCVDRVVFNIYASVMFWIFLRQVCHLKYDTRKGCRIETKQIFLLLLLLFNNDYTGFNCVLDSFVVYTVKTHSNSLIKVGKTFTMITIIVS